MFWFTPLNWCSSETNLSAHLERFLAAIQTCVTLLRQGRPAPHREARHKRRELRLKQQADQEELELRMKELQTANEAKQLELENMRKVRGCKYKEQAMMDSCSE